MCEWMGREGMRCTASLGLPGGGPKAGELSRWGAPTSPTCWVPVNRRGDVSLLKVRRALALTVRQFGITGRRGSLESRVFPT